MDNLKTVRTDLEMARDLRAGAERLRVQGWLQGDYGLRGGPRCLQGSLFPNHQFGDDPGPGDIEKKLAYDNVLELGCAMFAWNDAKGRTVEEVLDRLESTALALEVRALAASVDVDGEQRREGIPALSASEGTVGSSPTPVQPTSHTIAVRNEVSA